MKTMCFFFTRKLPLLILFVLLFSNTNAQIANWSYEPLQGSVSNPTSNTGLGNSSVVNLGGGTITPLTATGMNGTGCGAQVTGQTAWALQPFDPGLANETNGVQFNASTSGYQNIIFSWDQRWSNTAPNTLRLQYTLNGTTWISFNMTSANTTFCLGILNANGGFETNTTGDVFRRITVDFSSVNSANNNPNFAVRVLASHYQSTGEFRQTSTPTVVAGTTGTWRFDNVNFSGSLIPGPTSSLLSVVSSTAICAGSSTSISVAITGGLGPFTLIYSDGSTNTTVNNYLSNAAIVVTPVSTRTYSIVSVANANGALGTGNSGAAGITVNPLPAVPTSSNFTTCLSSPVALPVGIPAGGVYSIPNPYSGPTTTFTYTVTNASGCPRSSITYTFTRNTIPVVTVQPSTASQTQCQGNSFSPITVSATGSGTLLYQWFRNTINSTTGGTALTGASYAAEVANGSKTATFTPLSNTIGTYYYYATVSNSCTTVKSDNATGAFTVLPASVSGTISSSQIICAGETPNNLTVSGYSGNIIKWQKANDITFLSGVIDISSTAATLTSTEMGSIFQTTYFRVFIQNGTCPVVTTVPIQILIPTTTWNGSNWDNGLPTASKKLIFASSFTSTGNIDACSIQVLTGSIVTIQSNHTLTVVNQIIVDGPPLPCALILESEASLIQLNNLTNTSPIYYRRNSAPMRKFDYTYWSSPVLNQNLALFSPNTNISKFYTWDTASYNWLNINPNSTTMDLAKGYIVRAPDVAPFNTTTSNVFASEFFGIPNNGTITTPITVTGLNDLNLIGNPYPSAINADTFLMFNSLLNGGVLNGTLYFWTHNTPITSNNYSYNDYASYNLTGGVGTIAASSPCVGCNNSIPNGKIGSGQSFFIQGTGNGVATFNNAMRIAGNNNQFFKSNSLQSTTIEKNRIWIEIKNNQGAYKQTLVGYIQGATNEIDSQFDGSYLDIGNPIGLYSISNTNKLAIQGKTLPFNETDQVHLGFKTSIADNLEIKISNFDGLFTNQNIYLEDRLLNIIHDIKATPYTFSSPEGTFEDRFILRFTEANLGIQDLDNNELIVHKSQNNIVITSRNMTINNVSIFNIQGGLIYNLENSEQSNLEITSLPKNALLLVKIKTSNNQVFVKKIVL
jgi:hypothetical protein